MLPRCQIKLWYLKRLYNCRGFAHSTDVFIARLLLFQVRTNQARLPAANQANALISIILYRIKVSRLFINSPCSSFKIAICNQVNFFFLFSFQIRFWGQRTWATSTSSIKLYACFFPQHNLTCGFLFNPVSKSIQFSCDICTTHQNLS